MIRALLLLFVVVTLMANARAFVGNAEPPFGSGVSLAFGFLVLAAYMAGEAIASLRLPKLTGYLFLGLACGPSATNLVTSSMIERLSLVNGVAVGLIALTAGGEINLVELRPRLRLLSRLTAFSVIAGIVVCTVSVMALSSWLTFLSEYTLAQRVSIALLLGVVLASLSPAVVLALLSEQRAAGALSSSMLGAVVLGEVAIVLCFALAHSLAAAMFGGHTSEISPGLALAIELGGSAVVGVIAGAILALYVRRVNKQIALFVVALCLVVAEVGARLHLDVVIVCLTAGLCLENFFGVRGHVLARELEPATVPIFAVFFSVAGARLDLSLLAALMPIALTIAAVRALSFVAASYAAARVAGVEPTVRRWVVAGLLPQGGVSVGLAGMIASHFSGWGRGAASLALAVIAINQVIGPIITRLAVVSTGEAGQRADDAHSDAPSEHAALEDEPR